MKILYVGEIVAKPGREIVAKFLPEIIKENKVDIVFPYPALQLFLQHVNRHKDSQW